MAKTKSSWITLKHSLGMKNTLQTGTAQIPATLIESFVREL